MTDLTYELQRMVSRSSEIRESTKGDGAQAAWDKYSRAHDLDSRRFKSDLAKLRSRFDDIGSGRESSDE